MRKTLYADLSPGTIAILWTVKLVACGFLGYQGYAQLSGSEASVMLFTELGMEPAGRFIIGGLQILSVILLLIPQSAVYGALLGVHVMLGAVIAHVTVVGAFYLPDALLILPYVLLVLFCCSTVLYIRRNDAEFLRNLIDR